MACLARISVGRPIGQKALRTVPDMVLQIEDIRSLSNEPWRFIYWASDGDFEAYEDALSNDPSITAFKCLSELPDRRLYRVTLSDEGQHHTFQSVIVEEDIVAERITMTAEKVEVLTRFPSREALFAFRDACHEQNRYFELFSLYEESPTENDGVWSNQYGVTNRQREALLSALDQGYFSIPRKTTMEDIADSLEISTSALSSRLRRGQQVLLRNTLAQESSL